MAVPDSISSKTADPALVKILNVMGPERGWAAIEDAMRRAALTALLTPNDRFRFGCALMESGGMFVAIGRAIKIQAILHGAKVEGAAAD
jgi:hypothetical protein